MTRRFHGIPPLLSLLLSACLVTPERRAARRDSPTPFIDERSRRGFHGEVIQSETRLYAERKDATGTYRENTVRFVERFTETGALLESRTFDLVNDHVYGVTHPAPYEFYSYEATYDRGPEPKWYGTYRTDRSGKVIQETIESIQSNGSAQVEFECSHRYDGAGRRAGRDCRNAAGASAESSAVVFDEAGRTLRREQKGSILENIDLLSGGSWWESSLFGATRTLHFRETYAYSSGGDFTLDRTWIGNAEVATHRMIFRDSLMVSVLHFGPSGDTLGTEYYTYDPHGNVKEMKLDYDPWMAGWKWSDTYRYEYDTQGNWTVRLRYFVQSGSEQLSQEEKREITYR